MVETAAQKPVTDRSQTPSMKPPSFDGGNIRRALRALWPRQPSMKPPSFDGGNNPCHRPTLATPDPSMKPPSFDGGNVESPAPAALDNFPSMKPPSFDGGNGYPRAKDHTPLSPLNEATIFRWWKLGRLGAYTSATGPSMKPPSFDGGNSPCTYMYVRVIHPQ